MGRLARVIALLMASAVIATGVVLAATGIGQLQVFEPDDGLLGQRLTTVEDFLESNSQDVKTELQRMQREIDALEVTPTPTPTPTRTPTARTTTRTPTPTATPTADFKWTCGEEDAIQVRWRVVTKNSIYWTFSYQVSLVNRGDSEASGWYTVSFHDQNGFELDSDGGSLSLAAGESTTITDTALVDAANGPDVVCAKFEI